MSARREIALGLGSYGLYLGVRRAVFTEEGRARANRNARLLLRIEARLRCDVEHDIQAVALGAPRLVRALNTGYAIGNVGLSVGWLLWLYRSGNPAFGRERRAAVVAFLGALPFFLALPTAPPRSQVDFVDTLLERGIDLDNAVLVRAYNPIAAMPSHHMAFAVVTGIGMAEAAHHRWSRSAWLAYPGAVALTVVATANHYVVDVVAGAILGAGARHLTR